MLSIIIADNFFVKFKGLMGKKKIDIAMFFPNTNSIHTFFMKQNIDIVGLDIKMNVTEIYKNVKKNNIIFLKHSKHVLELPKNYSKDLKIGQHIDLKKGI